MEERRSYDPAATIQTLQDVAPTRTLIIDTTTVSAVAAALEIIHWLPQQSRMNEA
ncbi:MAG: hypothetical protein R2867_42770 [Caldilineaceae bacterium]